MLWGETVSFRRLFHAHSIAVNPLLEPLDLATFPCYALRVVFNNRICVTLIQSGGGIGPVKPRQPASKDGTVPSPAEFSGR